MTGNRGDLIRWILTEGHDAPPNRFLNALCRRLVEAGVPLWRVTIYSGTLHPQLRGLGWRWWRDRPLVEELRIVQGTEATEEYLSSPLRGPLEQGTTLRQRLEGISSEFPLLREFAAEGCTDYVAAP